MTSLRKQRARIHRIYWDACRRRLDSMVEDQLWDRMPAVGREFGSPDFDRLMEEDCRAVLAARERVQAGNTHEWHAAAEAIKLEDTEGGRKVAAVALAMAAFRLEHPHRFATGRAYEFQLVRRVRGQSAVNRGVTWDHKRQRSRTVYREMPPKATALLGSWLVAAYGSAGAQLALMEEDARTREAKTLETAIQALR